MRMLSRYEDKKIRLTTEDGAVLTGNAEAFPSVYGLRLFDRAEESVRIGGVHIFASDIKSIEFLPEREAVMPRQFDDLMGDLLEGPFWIVDILPEQVPAEAGGQYFAVERYFLQSGRIRELRRRFAEILLRLNCYYDMAVSFDSCGNWELNPEPEGFAARVTELSGNSFLRAVFETERAMIDIDPCDTYMTVYDPDSRLMDRLRKLAAAEGLIVWGPKE